MKRSNRNTRIYLSTQPTAQQLILDAEQAHYLANVLRLRAGDKVTAFDGEGHEWSTEVAGLTRRAGLLNIIDSLEPVPESPLELTLIQATVKSEAMDLIVQKATELGVTRITPATTQFSVVRLDEERIAKKTAHWLKVARSACEQSGRHCPPIIESPKPLADCLASLGERVIRIAMDPRSSSTALDFLADNNTGDRHVACLVGPEGGFGPDDEGLIDAAGMQRINFGGRILRAETAAISICAILQHLSGDLGRH